MLHERAGADYRGGNAPLLMLTDRGIDKRGGIGYNRNVQKSIDKIEGHGERDSSIILYL